MQLVLRKHGYPRIILGREVEPHHPVEKNKFQNLLDEDFGYVCTHIYRDILFHLEGLRTLREAWVSLKTCLEKNMSFGDTSWRMSW